MVFSSIIFLFYFLPFCLAGYFLTPTLALRNVFLLLASLLFYYWGEPRFLPVLLVSITVNFGLGLGLEHQGQRRIRVGIMVVEGQGPLQRHLGLLAQPLAQVTQPQLHIGSTRFITALAGLQRAVRTR